MRASVLLPVCFGLIASCSPARAAEPTEKLRAALQDFLDQPNYTWAVGNTRGMPEANGEDTEQVVDGQHEKGGYTKINFRRGPHIPAEEMPVRKPRPGYMDRDDYVASRWVFWTPEGWRLLSELPQPGPPIRSGPASRPGAITLGSGSLGRGVSFRRIGVRRPDHEVAIILANLDEVVPVRSGLFEVTLTPAGAVELLSPRMPSVLGFMAPAVEQATIRATISVREGELVQYELSCDATMRFGGRLGPYSFILLRTFRDLGTTEIEVPAEVRRALGDKSQL